MKLAQELAEKHWQIVCDDPGESFKEHIAFAVNETIDRVVSEAKDIMHSDYIYDLLPGDGQDDFVIGEFDKMLDARIKALKDGK